MSMETIDSTNITNSTNFTNSTNSTELPLIVSSTKTCSMLSIALLGIYFRRYINKRAGPNCVCKILFNEFVCKLRFNDTECRAHRHYCRCCWSDSNCKSKTHSCKCYIDTKIKCLALEHNCVCGLPHKTGCSVRIHRCICNIMPDSCLATSHFSESDFDTDSDTDSDSDSSVKDKGVEKYVDEHICICWKSSKCKAHIHTCSCPSRRCKTTVHNCACWKSDKCKSSTHLTMTEFITRVSLMHTSISEMSQSDDIVDVKRLH